MARNGSGTYNLPSGQPVVTGTTISSTVFNTLTADLAAALTTSVATDGQTAMTANLPMGGHKVTGLAAATGTGESLRYEQLFPSVLADILAVRNGLSASDSPFRNRVINGNMFEDQRNAGAGQTIVAGAALAYCVDRFYAFCTGGNVTGQQITALDGTRRYRMSGTAGVSTMGFGHRIEAANCVDLANNTCTLSAKFSNSLLTTVTWAVYYATSTDTFGTLASPTRTLIATGTFSAVSGTDTTYSQQIAVPAAATTGIEIVFSVGAQITGNWTIGEFLFEKGAVPAAAITFERVDVGINKARCLRYARPFPQLVVGQAYGTAVAFYGFDTGTPMRATPTASGGTYTTSNASGVAVSGTFAVTSMVGSVIRFDMSAVTGAPLVAGNVTMLVPPAGTPMLSAEL